jgi:hypothetical protein
MATTPDFSRIIEFAIAAIPQPTPLALSTKAWSNFVVEAALPTAEELAFFTTPGAEAIKFMKQRLLLAGVLTNLWKGLAKNPSYCDITSATERHTSAPLTVSLATRL